MEHPAVELKLVEDRLAGIEAKLKKFNLDEAQKEVLELAVLKIRVIIYQLKPIVLQDELLG